MEVTFANAKIQKLCNSEKKLRGKYGPQASAIIMRRLLDLAAAGNLEEMRILPGRCHELTGDLKGSLALDLKHPLRLIFEPNHDPRPQLAGGGLDWENVTRVTITAMLDYH